MKLSEVMTTTKPRTMKLSKVGGGGAGWEEQTPFQRKQATKIIPQLTKGLYENVPFGKRVVSMLPNAEQIKRTMETTPEPENIPAMIGRGVGEVAPDIAMSMPFTGGVGGVLGRLSKIKGLGGLAMSAVKTALGFGSYTGTKAGLAGEPILPAAIKGGLGAAAFHGGGRLGATLGKMGASAIPAKIAQKVLPYAGGIAGGAATGYGMGAIEGASEKEKIASGILGGGLMATTKPKAFGKSPFTLVREATNIYREILKPSKGEIKNLEIRKGDNVNKYFRLAAKENLPIKQTSDKKLDTSTAREVLTQKIDTIHSKLDSMLVNNKNKFDLIELGKKAKMNAKENIKNAKELNGINRDINDYVKAEVKRYGGKTVDAITANKIKQGLWSQGYDALKPTANKSARRLGFAIKDAINSALKEKNIKNLNKQSGDYLNLLSLLENAHGRTVQGGRLGGYFGRTIGAITGGMAGQFTPVPGVGAAAGAVAGQQIGAKIAERASSPEIKSKKAFSKIQKARRLSRPAFSGR